MKKFLLLCFVILFIGRSSAGVIISAVNVDVSAVDGSKYGTNHNSLIDQSGLSANYTPGVDDFDTFTSTTTAQYDRDLINYGLAGVAVLGSFYLDLGALYSVDAIATWGQDCCSSTMESYDLYTSDTFGAGGSRVLIGHFSAGTSPNAYVHYFNAVETQFLEIDVITNAGFSIATRVNEVVFGAASIVQGTAPVADAGDDITVYAGPDGTATVGLDGSRSYDADDDTLEYCWFENGSEIARGVDPNVVLAIGEHVIDLIVDDGNLNSEPDSVVVTVLEMPNTAPVADAGVDVTVFAGPDGTATVGLDGSGSYDADEDELEYFWFNDANDLIAEGVDPNVVFAAGVHVIDLVVDDGKDSSEPNSVVVTVIEAVEAQAHVFPRVLNITSRGRFVIARMQLPDGVLADDMESDSLTLTIGDVTIESVRQRGVTSMDRHYVFGFFDRSEVAAQGEGKPKLDIIIAGKLTTGQCIYGEDTIKIVKSNGPKKPTPSRKPVRYGRGSRVSR